MQRIKLLQQRIKGSCQRDTQLAQQTNQQVQRITHLVSPDNLAV